MLDFEIYEGRTEKQNRKKTYLVADAGVSFENIRKEAKKYFRASEAHILVITGWVLNDELYFFNPGKKGTKKKSVAFYF